MGADARRRTLRAAAGLAPVLVVLATGCETNLQTKLNCQTLGPYTQVIPTSASEDTLAGGIAHYEFTPGKLDGPIPDVAIKDVTIRVPLPPQVASVQWVRVTGGNLTGIGGVEGSDIVVRLSGGPKTGAVEYPKVAVHADVKAGTAGQQIAWKVYRSFDQRIQLGPNWELADKCWPANPDQVLNYTNILAPGEGSTPATTATTAPATTTTAAPATTAAPTTAAPTTAVPTTAAPTTTAAPATTTTTRPATTRPTATTTWAATTTTHGDHDH
jgi:hypothetical protein